MKLAVIEQITELIPIEGADRIELAKIQGWKSVVKKGTYNVGDVIVFVPIDTIIHYKEWNSFLWTEGKDITKPVRVKIKKLRNVVSSGVVFKIEDIFEIIEKDNKRYINIDESKHSIYEEQSNIHLSDKK